MIRMVFVHGMRQEGKNPAELRKVWQDALTAAWTRDGLPAPQYTLEMPFYGDVLNELTEAVRGGPSAVVTRGEGGPLTFTPLEEELIRAMAAKKEIMPTGQRITDAEVRAELGQEVVTRGPANWEWVQAIGRLLERQVPGLGNFGLKFVRQVDAYLTRPHIQKAVDDIVGPSLTQGRTIVVAHSLGTIVAYRLLRYATQSVDVPLFMTLGSPLGIETVKNNLQPPPRQIPAGVTKWLNGVDERDYVALVSRLGGTSFAANIEDIIDIHNRQSDAHFIVDYLSDTRISRRIHTALQ